MATPAFSIQSKSLQIVPGNPAALRINTFDSDGAAVDVSLGYTLDFLALTPQSDANPDKAAQDLKADCTPTFDTTDVSLAFSGANASAIAAALATLHSSFGVGISNDAGATASLIATGALTINRDKSLQS